MGYIHGGKVVARALRAENVPFVFTLCGGHVMSIYDGCLDEGIGVIDVRHEQTAGHAADGWARVTGRPGVAIVTAGPGLTDAVTAVASAHRANVPMIIIGGQGPRVFVDMGSLQDMNHVDLMRPITKWSVSVPSAKRLGEYVASAFRKATTNVPGPVFLEMPLDLLFEQVDEAEAVFPTQYRSEAGLAGDPRAIERAFALLKSAERPVAIVGNDAGWMQIRRGQEQLYGPDRTPATALAFTRYDRVVEALGGHGEYVEKPREIRPALERALASGKPALVNIKIGRSDFRKASVSV